MTCPACEAPLEPARAGRILGGIPTAADVEATRLPSSERAGRAAPARPDGGSAIRCGACGERLYRMGASVLPHRSAAPVITMAMAADRLRNHLRRRAIVRFGRIEGDCYLLPFVRFEGTTPEGDETFTLLAASIGEERLEAPFLLPADIKPFEPPAPGAAGASGSDHAVVRLLPPTMSVDALRARAGSLGWSATRPVELIHYPWWSMRVEDRGRIEGAWMDGIEGKRFHHRFLLPAPVPSQKSVAMWAALPAAVSVSAFGLASLALPAGCAAWILSAPLFRGALLRGWRG